MFLPSSPSKKPVIAVDIDEVLAPFLQSIINWHNDIYNTSFSKDDFFSYDFWHVWGGTRNEAIGKVLDFFKTTYFTEMEPIKNSVESINKLCTKYDLYIITGRQAVSQEATLKWLERYYPNCFVDVFFGNHYTVNEKSVSKSELCHQIGVDLLIDDMPNYANECAAADIKSLLFGDYAWNKTAQIEKNVKRVSNWQDVTDILLSER